MRLHQLTPRNILSRMVGLVWLASAVLWGSQALAADFVEGQHYQKIPIPVQPLSKEGVEVVEVFSYGCIHCYNFDPMVSAWSQSQDGIAFRRTPAIFNQSWALLAKAFYTAEVLGVSEQMHEPLFRAIHKEPINLGDPELMAQLFRTEAGVTEETFTQTFESFPVLSRVQQADGHGRAYRLRAVPSMVVQGQYLVDTSMVEGGNAEMLRVVEFLVEKVRATASSSVKEGAGE